MKSLLFLMQRAIVVIIRRTVRARRDIGTRGRTDIFKRKTFGSWGNLPSYLLGSDQYPSSSFSTRLGPRGRNPGASQWEKCSIKLHSCLGYWGASQLPTWIWRISWGEISLWLGLSWMRRKEVSIPHKGAQWIVHVTRGLNLWALLLS